MYRKIIINDCRRTSLVSGVILSFVSLSVLLFAMAAQLCVSLHDALGTFLSASQVPHYIQLTEGPVDQPAVFSWASHQHRVKQAQVVTMINVPASDVYFNSDRQGLASSVMNLDFVVQNPRFDYLLNGQYQQPRIAAGCVCVPIYFKKAFNLHIGDLLTLSKGRQKLELYISAFVHDGLMNPGIVHSKRFLVNSHDIKIVGRFSSHTQYLIEFRLQQPDKVNAFSDQYQQSGLPHAGPSMTFHLIAMLNSVADGVTIGVLIVVSVILMAVVFLCIRFAIISMIALDQRPIAVLSAIGAPYSFIRRVYAAKYLVLVVIGCLIGWGIGEAIKGWVLGHIAYFLGVAALSHGHAGCILLAILVIGLLCYLFCLLSLRRVKKMSFISVLRREDRRRKRSSMRVALLNQKYLNVNVWLGMKMIMQAWRSYLLLFVVFVLTAFILLVPIHLYNTLKSRDFIQYMGVGRSDVRIDLRGADNQPVNRQRTLRLLEGSKAVKQYALNQTYLFRVDAPRSVYLKVGLGDQSAFPVVYMKGHSPSTPEEIGLSYLSTKKLNKGVGDAVTLVGQHGNIRRVVSGVYQDITNGGLTAKGVFSVNNRMPLWGTINIDLMPTVKARVLMAQLKSMLSVSRVTDIDDYLMQTMRPLVNQVAQVVYVTAAVAIVLMILMAALFTQMLIVRYRHQFVILRRVGFSSRHLNIQILCSTVIVLLSAVCVGTVLSTSIGEAIVAFVWGLMGAPSIQFIVSPALVYGVCPLAMIMLISATVFWVANSLNRGNVMMIEE